jgi:hypothetical protein
MSETKTPADEPAHDILAAEAFAVPAPDPSLHHGPLVLPDDPTGIAEPHDVLAAEEFAMPAGHPSHDDGVSTRSAHARWRLGIGAAAAALLLIATLHAVRRRGRAAAGH